MGGGAASGDVTMENVKQVFANVFDLDPTGVTPDLRLDAIDGWDSMASVNLQLELESTFGVNLQDQPPAGEQTVADIVLLLRSKGAAV